MTDRLDRVRSRRDALHADTRAQRRHAAGLRTARENVADLVDADTFVEYGGLAVAAQRARLSREQLVERTPADGVVVGTGRVDGRPTAVIAYDYTVLAGTQGATGHRKTDRLLDVAAREGLPLVLFAEGGGGRPSDTDHATTAGLELGTFAALARLTAPRIGIAAGNCFAGNAALLGTCDVTIGVTGASIGMGGPAMIEAAGFGSVTAAEVGPLDVHLASGAIDLEAPDEAAAVDVARRLLALGAPTSDAPAADQTALRDALPESRRRAYDVRAIVDLLCDTGTVVELQARHARPMATVLARIGGRGVGVLANNPIHGAGAIDAAAARKAARFLRLCDRLGLPVVTLCDTPGIMVGPEAERTGLVRAIGDLFNAAGALRPPLVTVMLRKAYGLGAMAMAGGGFHVPRLTLAWPTGEVGPMALEGAVRLAFGKELAAIDDEAERAQRYDALVALAYERGDALSAAEHFELDDVIDPADTRATIVAALA